MDRAEAIAAARTKLKAAKYHLRRLQETESMRRLDESQEQFEIECPAFLAATRSAAQFISEAEGKWDWEREIKSHWQREEIELYDALKELRNAMIHRGLCKVPSSIQFIPESQMPTVPRHPFEGRVNRRRLPGMPENQPGVMRFTMRVADEDKPVLECCAKYLELSYRLINVYADGPTDLLC